MHLTCYSAEMANERGSLDVKPGTQAAVDLGQWRYLPGNWIRPSDAQLAQRRVAADVLVTAFGDKVVAVVEASRYPHTCPRCQGPAYVGAVEVDCAGGCK